MIAMTADPLCHFSLIRSLHKTDLDLEKVAKKYSDFC